jgi:hypothetical protein
MLNEVIIPVSSTENHANSSWNLPAVNAMSAVDGKNLLTELSWHGTHQRGAQLGKI